MNQLIDKNTHKLAFIGILTGIVASIVGGGAEILIVPLLIYLKVFDDYKIAIGTSLASLLLPIGIVAVYFYGKHKCGNESCVKWTYAFIISICFVIGSFASYFTSQLEAKYLKRGFATLLIVFGIVMWMEGE